MVEGMVRFYLHRTAVVTMHISARQKESCTCLQTWKAFSDRKALTCCFMSFVFRVKELVLSLYRAMSALTACLTSWSTSLSTTDFASTSSVLVSVSCEISSLCLQAQCLCFSSSVSTRQKAAQCLTLSFLFACFGYCND